ncbi:MAG: MFS transporter [Pseudomonadota bacterium]
MTFRHIRVAAFISTVFLGLGVYLPFFPLLLSEKSFAPEEVAILVAVPIAAKLIATPAITAALGRFKDRRKGAFVYCLAAAFSFLALSVSDGFLAALICLAVFGAFWNALIPVGDSFALYEVRNSSADYGHIRLWGSLAFIVANLLAGVVIADLDATSGLLLIALLIFSAGATARVLPPPITSSDLTSTRTQAKPRISQDLRDPQFFCVALVAGAIQSSHAMIYTFGSVHWQTLGFSTAEIGSFWAIGVVSEILLFLTAGFFLSRVPSVALIVLGGAFAMVRWWLHPMTTDFVSILVLQLLHGITFGATHFGVQSFISRNRSDAATPGAQAAIVLVSGIFTVATTLVAGVLYREYAAGAFVFMAGLAGLGLLPLLMFFSPKVRDQADQ